MTSTAPSSSLPRPDPWALKSKNLKKTKAPLVLLTTALVLCLVLLVTALNSGSAWGLNPQGLASFHALLGMRPRYLALSYSWPDDGSAATSAVPFPVQQGASQVVATGSGCKSGDRVGAALYYDKVYYWNFQRAVGMRKFNQTWHGPPLQANWTVLEFGCGGCFVLGGQVRPHVNRTIGVEVNPWAVADAREHKRVDLVVNNLEDVESDSVDLAFSFSVLEHVECPVCVLRQHLRVLRPSGLLLVGVVHETTPNPYVGPLKERDHHLYTWSENLLGNTIEAAGFQPSSIRVRQEFNHPAGRYLYGTASKPA